MLRNGVAPSILDNAVELYDPIYAYFNKAIYQLNLFSDNQDFALIHSEYIRDDKNNLNYDTNWKNLKYYVDKCLEELDIAHEHLHQASLLIEKEVGCQFVAQECRNMMTAISGLKRGIDALRQLGLSHGNPNREILDEFEKVNGYLDDLQKAKENITNGLISCGYRDKVKQKK